MISGHPLLKQLGSRDVFTSWSSICREGLSVLIFSPAPSGTSRLSGGPSWSSTWLAAAADPSKSPSLRTSFSLVLRWPPELSCWPPRVWNGRHYPELKPRTVSPYPLGLISLYFLCFGFQLFSLRVVRLSPEHRCQQSTLSLSLSAYLDLAALSRSSLSASSCLFFSILSRSSRNLSCCLMSWVTS